MILVTGGTGLIGSYLLLDLTRSGEKVRALKRPTSDLSHVRNIFNIYENNHEMLFNKIEWIEGDLLDILSLEEAMDDVEEVYHAAATVSFYRRDKWSMLRNNIEGTENVVNAALEKKIRKLCFVSSIAALGRPENHDTLIDENLFWKESKYNSNYAISKYGAEREIWRGIEEGLNAVIVNPSIVLGIANTSKSIYKLFETVHRGLRFYPPGVNGYVDVKDVTRAMITLMKSDIKNERFILNNVNVSYQELFTKIALLYGKKPPTIRTNKIMIDMAWRAEWLRSVLTGKAPVLTRETARTSGKKSLYSSDKIKSRLNFQYRDFEETLKEYGDYYRMRF